LIRDAAGNLYGSTIGGGAHHAGTVFKLDAGGNETVLHHFTGGVGGASPYAGLIRDAAGNLYGVTGGGGKLPCPIGSDGCGTVFKLAPTGALTTLHAFAGGGTEGALPTSSLILDAAGNLYGNTFYGGDLNCSFSGCGTVFKIAPSGAFTTLHTFTGPFSGGATEGESPSGPLILDEAGNLYGTTAGGGARIGGTVFKLDATGQITNLHNFNGGDGGELENDPGGKNPRGGVLRNAAGVLYGTTSGGGVSRWGVVFRLNVDSGAKTVLHTFTGKADGGPPQGPLVGDSAGNLYGTTSAGGDLTCHAADGGCGLVFKIKGP
jgi:uncharacterized repeat protein (TIGR03803 family)